MLKRIFIVAAVALTLGGCAGTPARDFFTKAVTGTLPNPVSTTNIYQVKNVYAIAAQGAVEYRGYCYARPYATLMADPIAKPLCQNRRTVVRTIQAADAKAVSAINSADSFVRNNPTLDATKVIGEAWSAVTSFQHATPSVPK